MAHGPIVRARRLCENREVKELKVSIELPEDVPPDGLENAQLAAFEAAILSLWKSGCLSTREAAKRLGLTYHEFLELLDTRGIPVVTQAPRSEFVQAKFSKLRAEGRARS